MSLIANVEQLVFERSSIDVHPSCSFGLPHGEKFRKEIRKWSYYRQAHNIKCGQCALSSRSMTQAFNFLDWSKEDKKEIRINFRKIIGASPLRKKDSEMVQSKTLCRSMAQVKLSKFSNFNKNIGYRFQMAFLWIVLFCLQ